ncbi:hypothetical protein BU24DRAFT_489 [Aaosphaeria arxii CBS 175.79]|uniref:Uncharacterized protein n=1 Tax=Aaosphaeria arxii CBS 175.79 TaxID=1450172 RepID=A0A6A5Y4A1_9PLEO|nr:uncharacterized protein BU24DRAFT_489 [Aaosphaeria arxii CBS 175.79]KAF2020382.1 hypothetical protein BU24DRAFT_489 [Aaosphaeria arxii CBS 175.79]
MGDGLYDMCVKSFYGIHWGKLICYGLSSYQLVRVRFIRQRSSAVSGRIRREKNELARAGKKLYTSCNSVVS